MQKRGRKGRDFHSRKRIEVQSAMEAAVAAAAAQQNKKK